jgi:hypothetical protein
MPSQRRFGLANPRGKLVDDSPGAIAVPYRGAPLHVHHGVDGWIYILGGEFAAEVGEERIGLRTEDSLLLPMKIPLRWSIAHTPEAGAIHLYFDPDPAGAKQLSWEDRKAVFEEHHFSLLGPPLSQEKIDSAR